MINASLQGFYALLMKCYGDAYFARSQEITTSPNIALTSLPTRCVKLTRLWWLRAPDDVVQVHRAGVEGLQVANYVARAWSQCAPFYRLQGANTVQWLPIPTEAYRVTCDHIATPADLVADTDAFDAGLGWEEWVINDVCRKIAAKEQTDPTVYLSERNDWER